MAIGKYKIPYNKPYLTGNELDYIKQAVESGKLSGNGVFTKKCHAFFETKYNFQKCLLTSSCTDALEMCALLIDVKQDDEIIIPSYTFVSTANAFALRGARIVFADSSRINPNIDADRIEELITPRTKAIVVVHYAGIACDMDKITELAVKHSLFVIEDSAQSIDSYYKGKPLGSIGHLATFSFHETKNIISGEGGMLVINDGRFNQRAEIIWEKGTNRAAFWRGEVDKYNWVDVGSSFLPSELTAAFLLAQLENLETIQAKRKDLWDTYNKALKPLEAKKLITLPRIPDFATNNAHMFYIVCGSNEERDELIKFLKANYIYAVFHYLPLHRSPFGWDKYSFHDLTNCDLYSERLLRLPLFFSLTKDEAVFVSEKIIEFYGAG